MTDHSAYAGAVASATFFNQDARIDQLKDALRRIDAEVSGCGPECSKDFLRLGLTSVREIARAALTI